MEYIVMAYLLGIGFIIGLYAEARSKDTKTEHATAAAEKEERILIARSTDYTITDTDKGALFEGEIEPHCANVFTRPEGIKKISSHLLMCDISTMDTDEIAKVALNALLEKGE